MCYLALFKTWHWLQSNTSKTSVGNKTIRILFAALADPDNPGLIAVVPEIMIQNT